MSFILYCLGVFFAYYLFNCSDIMESVRTWVLDPKRTPEAVSYAMQCAFCATFWVTLAALGAAQVPLSWLFAAPVINLFLIKILNRL